MAFSNVINNHDSYLFSELIFTETKQLEEANYTVILQVNDTSFLQTDPGRDGTVRTINYFS